MAWSPAVAHGYWALTKARPLMKEQGDAGTHRSDGKQCKSWRGLVAHGFPWVLGARRCTWFGAGVAWSPAVSRGYWALAAAREPSDVGTEMQSPVCPIYLSTCRSRCGLVARGCPWVLDTRRNK